MPAPARRLNRKTALVIISSAILIGTELAAMVGAGGWALANLFDLGLYGMYALQALFLIPAVWGIVAFLKMANRAEPMFERDPR